MLRRHLAALVSSLLLAALTPTFVAAQSPAPASGSAGAPAAPAPPSAVVTVAVDLWPEALDPALAQGGTPTVVAALHEPLVRYKPDTLEFDPGLSLADKVTPAGDGLLWEIALKPEQKFSDGTPLDAEAAAFSLSRLLKADHPAKPARQAIPESARGLVKTIVVRDKTNLVIELTAPYSPLMGILASPHAGIISPASFKDGKLARVPLGAGPFVVAKDGPGHRLELAPNAKLNRPRTGLPRVHVVPAPAGTARLLWLLSGRGDMVEGLSRRDETDLAAFPKFKVARAPGLGMVTLYLSPTATPFQAPLLREAVIRGIPDELLAHFLYESKANVTRGFFPAWAWGSRGLFKPYGFDPVEAKRLIQTANIDRNGTAFVMWVVPPASVRTESLPPFLESLRAALRELSISCLTEIVPRAQLPERLAGQGPQAILYWHDAFLADPDEVAAQCVHRDQMLAKFSNSVAMDEVQSLALQARTRESTSAREFLYQQLEEKMVSALSTISLGCPQRTVAHGERLAGFKFGMDGLISLEDLRFGP